MGIVGKNGIGKTTLLRVIAGILKPFEGEVILDGKNIFEMRSIERARRICFLPQFYESEVPFTVYEMVELASYPGRRRVDGKEIEKILEKFGLLHYKDKKFSELSGGEKQKVLLARCFMQNPVIFLLDEPSLHLDFENSLFIFEILKKEVKQKNKILIFVLHDLNLIFKFADKILFFKKDGETVFVDKEEIFSDKKLLRDILNIQIEPVKIKDKIVFTY